METLLAALLVAFAVGLYVVLTVLLVRGAKVDDLMVAEDDGENDRYL